MYDPSSSWNNCRLYCSNCGRLVYGSISKSGRMKQVCSSCFTTLVRTEVKDARGRELVNILLIPKDGCKIIK